MEIGLIGLGKMGMNLALNMVSQGIKVIGYDLNQESMNVAKKHGVGIAMGLQDLVNRLPEKKIIWVMVPSGEITKQTISQVAALLSTGDIVVDGGNSHYKDSIEHSQQLSKQGIFFFDCGTSGGMNGARNGGNFMIGGDREAFEELTPIFSMISEEGGYLYTGESGSGHYLKMIHNGIEYGMMQAIGEGFDLLHKSAFDYDNQKVAELWNSGSVVRSWLMELAADAFREDPELEKIKGVMYSSGEGRWTVEEALELQVSIPVITTSLMMRYRSLEEDTFTGKVVASLRKGFGGHTVKE